jgi:hypothetical protein
MSQLSSGGGQIFCIQRSRRLGRFRPGNLLLSLPPQHEILLQRSGHSPDDRLGNLGGNKDIVNSIDPVLSTKILPSAALFRKTGSGLKLRD